MVGNRIVNVSTATCLQVQGISDVRRTIPSPVQITPDQAKACMNACKSASIHCHYMSIPAYLTIYRTYAYTSSYICIANTCLHPWLEQIGWQTHLQRPHLKTLPSQLAPVVGVVVGLNMAVPVQLQAEYGLNGLLICSLCLVFPPCNNRTHRFAGADVLLLFWALSVVAKFASEGGRCKLE